MARIPLLGGAYSARTIISSAQRCVNLYPEVTPESTTPPTPVVHQLTPGLLLQTQPGPDNGRCAYTATNGKLFMAIGNSVFHIDPSIGGSTLVGIVANADTPSSISDNGTVAVLVDGTGTGYVWDINTLAFSTIVDAAFYGADRVVCIDGWFAFNRPGTSQFYLSPNNWNGSDPFDPLYIASKTGGPDRIISIAALRGELWLIGLYTTEVWYNSGDVDFPFTRQPGTLMQHGMLPGWSLVTVDVNVFWLGHDAQGRCIVFMGRGYEAVRVSNSALEYALQIAPEDIDDAVAYTYQQDGHTFYVISFPILDQTWAYDLLTSQWHERTWTDPANGSEHRHRVNCAAFAYNKNFGLDWQNGKVYWYSQSWYTDDFNPIVRRRGFPHLVADGKRLSHSSFILDMDVDNQGVGFTGTPTVYVRWSDTRGASFGPPVALPMGYNDPDPLYRSLIIRRLGMARDRVYEVYWDFALPTALQGAWLEVERAET